MINLWCSYREDIGVHPAIVVLEPLALDKQLFTLAASLPNVWIVQASPMVRVLTTYESVL